MDALPDEILGVILRDNEHAASCSRRHRRIVLDASQLLGWMRVLLFGTARDIRRLSYAEIHHHVYVRCTTRRRHAVHMPFHRALREWNARARDPIDSPSPRRRMRMLADVILYASRTRPRGTPCAPCAIRRATRVEGLACDDDGCALARHGAAPIGAAP